MTLNFVEHNRSYKHNTYIYPVLSRRSGGISVGINLNINNACNWRCVYCQVDGLIRGKPNDLDLVKLESELETMIIDLLFSDLLMQLAPDGMQRFNDIAISGNGEPTLSKQLAEVLQIIDKLYQKYNLFTYGIKIILITNGSFANANNIQYSLELLKKLSAIIWFKIDTVTTDGLLKTNQIHYSILQITNNLKLASSFCNIQIQTCFFKQNNLLPDTYEVGEYINFLIQNKQYFTMVLLYSVSRPSLLPEGKNISTVNRDFLDSIANTLRQHDILVSCY